MVITVQDGPPLLLRNDLSGPARESWISLTLLGMKSNRDGVGAMVTLRAGGREQMREVSRGGSYLSSQDIRLHFGLGAARVVEKAVVRWPSGTVDEVGPLAVGAAYVIREGSGAASRR
jgi:hypothetical protein